MYLEHEELLKLVNTLEKERDEARMEAYAIANALRSARVTQLTQTVEADLLPYAIETDETLFWCRYVIGRYTPQ